MASSYSTSLKIELIGNGDQSGTWGTTTNNNLGTIIEQAITGVQTITMSNADYTLTNYNGVSDEARNAVLVATGTNSAIRQIICPLVNKLYVIYNNTSGGYAITIGGATGSIVTIPNGTTAQVYCDGTNFFSSQTGSAGNFNVNGNLTVGGTSTLTGATAITGALSGSTAVFSGAISSVSPAFTGTPTAPTASVGNSSTQIATTAFVQANNGSPTGTINMWPTATAPTGFLLCDGTAVSRSTYAALYAVIGSTFGSGDGSTTFNVPNYTNRTPYGTTIGATGGSADAVVVSHTHTAAVTDPQHTHGFNFIDGLSSGNLTTTNYIARSVVGTNQYALAQGGSPTVNTVSINSASTGITVANSTTGVSGTNANLPPYLGINFIIKT
jgi:microcystin-dependent protein